MAIVYDNSVSVSSGANVASLTSASWAIAGSDRYLVAGAASGAGTRANLSSVKWGGSGGTNLTQIGGYIDFSTAQPFLRVSQWGLVAPAVQTSTLYAAWAANQDETGLAGASYTGVDQTTSLGTQSTASQDLVTASTPAPSVTPTTVADDMVVDVMWSGDVAGTNHTITVGAGQTSRQEVEGATLKYECLGLSEELAVGASTTMTWTFSGAINGGWGILAVPLKPVAVAGGLPYQPWVQRSPILAQ